MKLIIYIDLENTPGGKKINKVLKKALKKKLPKLSKKHKADITMENHKKKSFRIISESNELKDIEGMRREWDELFHGFKTPETKKDIDMSLRDKASLARGKMSKGVKQKSIWITKKFRVKYSYRVIK